MTSGTQVVPSVDTEKTERFERADRFLERVAALSPDEWGRLDAAGQRLAVSDPMAAWRRAQRQTEMGLMPPAVEGLMSIVDRAAELVAELARALGLRGAPRPAIAADAASAADAERMRAHFQRLADIAQAQPGGQRDAVHALSEGLLALHTRHMRTPKSFRRAYAPVEPVIPAASL